MLAKGARSTPWIWLLLLAARPVGAEVAIEVGSASGLPGESTVLEVRLRSAGLMVGQTQNNLRFEAQTPVAVRGERPSCVRGDDLPNPVGSAFSFQPPGCTPGAGCGVDALILLLYSLQGIPDGAVLYTCTVEISSSAEPGSHPVRCANASTADVDNTPLSASCVDGVVNVVGTAPTATRTVAFTPPSPTATPTASITPTVASTPTSGGTSSGCQIDASGAERPWMLMAAMATVALLRRPRSHEGNGRLD